MAINLSGVIVIPVCFFLACMKDTNGQGKPSNAVAEIGREAIFNCSGTSYVPNWHISKDGTSWTIIAGGCNVNANVQNHYRTEPQTGTYICNLIVFNITMEQAGAYRCSESETYYALLTVIDNFPVLVYNETQGVVVEEENVIITCTLNHNGSVAPAPTLRPYFYWTDSSGQNFSSSFDNTTQKTAVSQITVTAGRQNIPPHTCHVYLQLKPPSNPNYANNTPTVNNMASSPNIEVLYRPSTPNISRVIRNLTGSNCTLTELTCSSSANPASNYTWTDISNGYIFKNNSGVFSWAEDSTTYECTATNPIRTESKSSSANYTVGVSSSLPCASVKDDDIRICSDDGQCDNETRSCSSGSHIYLTCIVSKVYPKPTLCQWQDEKGKPLSNTSFNATMNGRYRVLAYNEINVMMNKSAEKHVEVTQCRAKWKLIVSFIIPWVVKCLIVTIIFVVCYATLATPFRAKMLSGFPWLDYMLPCIKKPKVKLHRAAENVENTPVPKWKTFVFVLLLVVVSVTCGIIFFPILITIAYFSPKAKGDGQNVNNGTPKGRPAYLIRLIILMWFGVVVFMFPLTFVVVYFVDYEQMTFQYVVSA